LNDISDGPLSGGAVDEGVIIGDSNCFAGISEEKVNGWNCDDRAGEESRTSVGDVGEVLRLPVYDETDEVPPSSAGDNTTFWSCGDTEVARLSRNVGAADVIEHPNDVGEHLGNKG